jgi:hypothetical protein
VEVFNPTRYPWFKDEFNAVYKGPTLPPFVRGLLDPRTVKTE